MYALEWVNTDSYSTGICWRLCWLPCAYSDCSQGGKSLFSSSFDTWMYLSMAICVNEYTKYKILYICIWHILVYTCRVKLKNQLNLCNFSIRIYKHKKHLHFYKYVLVKESKYLPHNRTMLGILCPVFRYQYKTCSWRRKQRRAWESWATTTVCSERLRCLLWQVQNLATQGSKQPTLCLNFEALLYWQGHVLQEGRERKEFVQAQRVPYPRIKGGEETAMISFDIITIKNSNDSTHY